MRTYNNADKNKRKDRQHQQQQLQQESREEEEEGEEAVSAMGGATNASSHESSRSSLLETCSLMSRPEGTLNVHVSVKKPARSSGTSPCGWIDAWLAPVRKLCSRRRTRMTWCLACLVA